MKNIAHFDSDFEISIVNYLIETDKELHKKDENNDTPVKKN